MSSLLWTQSWGLMRIKYLGIIYSCSWLANSDNLNSINHQQLQLRPRVNLLAIYDPLCYFDSSTWDDWVDKIVILSYLDHLTSLSWEDPIHFTSSHTVPSLIARFIGPTWGPSGADRTQVGPMMAPWSLLSAMAYPPTARACPCNMYMFGCALIFSGYIMTPY